MVTKKAGDGQSSTAGPGWHLTVLVIRAMCGVFELFAALLNVLTGTCHRVAAGEHQTEKEGEENGNLVLVFHTGSPFARSMPHKRS